MKTTKEEKIILNKLRKGWTLWRFSDSKVGYLVFNTGGTQPLDRKVIDKLHKKNLIQVDWKQSHKTHDGMEIVYKERT